MNSRKLNGLCLGLLLALGVESAPAKAGHEITMIYRIAGEPSGRYHEAVTRDVEGRTKTTMESDFIFNRMGSKVELKSSSVYEESAGGDFAAVATDTSSSQQTTHMSAEVKESTIEITTATGGKSYERGVSFSGKLTGPNGARQMILAKLHAPGDTLSYQTFSPELGSVVTVTDTLVGNEELTIEGEVVKSEKLEQTMTGVPGKTTVWIDSEGWMVRGVMPGPFGDIEALRTQAPETAVAKFGGSSLPAETFSRSIIKANVRLPDERQIERLKVKITQRRPELGWPDLAADNQRVIEKTPNYVVLEVTRLEPKASTVRPEKAASAMAPYLAPNALLQADDAEVRRIAASVVGNERDAWRAAQALQRWTKENMHFDLGIAIVPASEVARNRRGTCFGYAMMLGALARAAGIPSRLRMGYAYVDGVWGGHAWVDVRIGDGWIPLDSALYSPGTADAARFSFFTGSLEEGTLAGIGSLQQLFGNVDIEILEYTLAGKTVGVGE